MKNKKIFLFAVLFAILCIFTNVKAQVYGSTNNPHCLKLTEVRDNGFPIAEVTVNGDVWVEADDEFRSPEGEYSIVILAGKNGNSFPILSLPGNINAETKARVNPNDDANVVGDEYILTAHMMEYYNIGEQCNSFAIGVTDGPEPLEDAVSTLSVTINGENLEWHEPSDEASHFTFSINDSDMIFLSSDNLSFVREDGKIVSGSTVDDITLSYLPTGNKVTLHMHSNPSEYIESMTINGIAYDTPNTREEMINAFDRDMLCLDFAIDNIPSAARYEIVINAVRLAREDELTGGFGWNYSAHGDIDGASDRIPYGTIEFVKAVYNGVEYNSVSEFKLANKLFEWHGAIKKDNYEIGDRDCFGYTFFPTGTIVTIKIIPDSGYQLVGLRNSGQEFVREDEPGVYTFNMPAGIAALQANFVPVGNEVNAKADRVSDGSISNVAFDNGTAKLEVDNVSSMSPQREEKFVEAASGYEIDNYLEISLYNTIYKGGMKDENDNYLAWDREITNLDKNATLELEVTDLNASDVVVIHETHDENNNVAGYEVIEATYNEDNHKITFETDSFSTYAIAIKKGEESNQNEGNEENHPDEAPKFSVYFNSNGGTEIGEIIISQGEKVQKPKDPVNGKMKFVGWFIDEIFTKEFDFNTPITENITLYAKWDEEVEETEEYTISDENGNSINFNGEENRQYRLNINNYYGLSDAELEKNNIPKETYNYVLEGITEAAKGEGTVLAFYEIEVYNDDDFQVHEGPFNIRIKMTSDMKKFDTFKLIYIDLEDNMKTEKPIILTVDGDYLVGTLDHLSTYILVGSQSEINIPSSNPQTGDNIYNWVMILIVSMIGLFLCNKVFKKLSDN